VPISLDFACDALRLRRCVAFRHLRSQGCLSVATEAGAPEAILYLQSGHGPAMPARASMHPQTPARLVETVEAFDLCLA
jgi:hypothetical protein